MIRTDNLHYLWGIELKTYNPIKPTIRPMKMFIALARKKLFLDSANNGSAPCPS